MGSVGVSIGPLFLCGHCAARVLGLLLPARPIVRRPENARARRAVHLRGLLQLSSGRCARRQAPARAADRRRRDHPACSARGLLGSPGMEGSVRIEGLHQPSGGIREDVRRQADLHTADGGRRPRRAQWQRRAGRAPRRASGGGEAAPAAADRRPRRRGISPAVDRPARRAHCRRQPSRSTLWWR